MLLLRTIMMVVEVMNMWRDLLTCLVLLLRQGCVSFTNQSFSRAWMGDLDTFAIRCLISFFL